MRIATWNVEYARPSRRDALRTVLHENPADIWVLTETHDELVPIGFEYSAHSEQRPFEAREVREGSRWVSIWSRFPAKKLEDFELQRPDRTVVVKVEAPDKTLIVYGTVIPWKGDGDQFNWDAHHIGISEQSVEWKSLKRTHPDADLCIIGDYNTDMGTGAYYGTRRGISALNNAFSECGLFCATVPSRVPSGLLNHPPIDHIALPEAWSDRTQLVRAWNADKKHLSDHSGLVVEIDF